MAVHTSHHIYIYIYIDEELRKPKKLIDIVRLEALLQQAIHTSLTGENDHSQGITVRLENKSVVQHAQDIEDKAGVTNTGGGSENLSGAGAAAALALHNTSDFHQDHNLMGYNAVTLNYEIDWPLVLIISRQSIVKYQMLFRHIFCCKVKPHNILIVI